MKKFFNRKNHIEIWLHAYKYIVKCTIEMAICSCQLNFIKLKFFKKFWVVKQFFKIIVGNDHGGGSEFQYYAGKANYGFGFFKGRGDIVRSHGSHFNLTAYYLSGSSMQINCVLV